MMHPMFVKLFIETDAHDLLDEEETRRRSARRPRRSRRAAVVTAAPRHRSSQPVPRSKSLRAACPTWVDLVRDTARP